MASNLPSDWDSRRKKIYQRDNYTCQNCGVQDVERTDVEFHAHHIVPKARGGSHKMSNLITLCKECHTTVHSKSKKAPTARNHSGIDFGELSDSILDSILKMISAAKEVMARDSDVPLREERDNLSENAEQLRSLSLTITNSAVKLEEANRQRYPEEVVTTSEDAIDAGIETIEPMLEAIELISVEMDKAIEDELTCPECDGAVEADDQFCAGCGAEIERNPRECEECGTELSLLDASCPNCGVTPDLDSIETESEDTQQVITDIKQYIEEMEDKAGIFQMKMEKRTKAIEKHS